MKRLGDQTGIPVAFMRGGTSKAMVFKEENLPAETAAKEAIFLAAMGSPDSYGRQLDGMGGGISSLSKVCIVGPPTHPDADIDYTFYQVGIRDRKVDRSGNCGNMSSAIGPFAADEKIVSVPANGEVTVRIHNTNTGKLIKSTFQMRDGYAAVNGDTSIIGIDGCAAGIRLDFLEPGGTKGRGVLPAASPTIELLLTSNGRKVPASIVDSANACVFIEAAELGGTAMESPDELAANQGLMTLLEELRCAASVAMGLSTSPENAGKIPAIPKIAIIGKPGDYTSLDGKLIRRENYDVSVRMLSMEQPHKAIPLTGALCVATAARLPGTLVEYITKAKGNIIKIGTPSGILEVDAEVLIDANGTPMVNRASVWRTARRLMDGYVFVPQRIKEF